MQYPSCHFFFNIKHFLQWTIIVVCKQVNKPFIQHETVKHCLPEITIEVLNQNREAKHMAVPSKKLQGQQQHMRESSSYCSTLL